MPIHLVIDLMHGQSCITKEVIVLFLPNKQKTVEALDNFAKKKEGNKQLDPSMSKTNIIACKNQIES